MRLHRPLLSALSAACIDIFRDGKYADKAVERLLKSNPKWGSRDRAFLAENTYEIVRWKRLLEALDGPSPLADEQHFFRLAGVNLILKNVELPDWEEFSGLDPTAIFNKKKSLAIDRRIAQSIPDWLDEVGTAELGDQWEAELAALNQTASVVLRANTLKTTAQELQKLLAAEGWESENTPLAQDALVLQKRGNIFQSPLFKKGCFELQDAGSQCIAPFLQVEPGMRVVDACAGAGGKSLHLAALMENKGSIIALDTEAWKLTELQKRARRNGVHIIQARPIESTKTIKRLHNTADRLLLDVPCSGLGVLRRNPDAKWKLSQEFLDRVRGMQADIIRAYSKIVRPGGKMVYATCSILPSENERQVELFLAENKAFVRLDERHISPSGQGFDGFYMALMERTRV
ncbi:MAG: RNA methyltransferase [Lewinellaceae bacterium]|nr:RNA methyltransferase [Saprospiraceae bacterium]MCB9336608.1 RNA methyltransferase [Lewinellaceae bacterium]